MTGVLTVPVARRGRVARGSLLPTASLVFTLAGSLAGGWAVLALPEERVSALNDPFAAAGMLMGMCGLAVVGWALWRNGAAAVMSRLMLATATAWIASSVLLVLAIALQDAGAPGAAAAGWTTNWAWMPGQALYLVILLRFPTGRLPGPSWRWVERAVVGWAGLTMLVAALLPGPLGGEELAPATNPLGIEPLGPALDGALAALFTAMPLLILSAAAAPVVRWRRADGQERRQLLWVAGAAALLALSAPLAIVSERGDLLQGLAMLLLPGAVALAVLREQLWDVDVRRRLDRLSSVREEERERLRQDLHDTLGPVLGAIAMRVEAARNVLADAGPAGIDDVLVAIGEESRGALAEVRRMIEELGPSVLVGRDLAGALRIHLATWEPAFHADLQVGTVPPDLPARTEEAAFLVVAEAVRNASRHSGTDRCRVHLTQEQGRLVVTISDSGPGLRGRPAGVGRHAMQRRARAAGGSVDVRDEAGGTTVVLDLPGGDS